MANYKRTITTRAGSNRRGVIFPWRFAQSPLALPSSSPSTPSQVGTAGFMLLNQQDPPARLPTPPASGQTRIPSLSPPSLGQALLPAVIPVSPPSTNPTPQQILQPLVQPPPVTPMPPLRSRTLARNRTPQQHLRSHFLLRPQMLDDKHHFHLRHGVFLHLQCTTQILKTDTRIFRTRGKARLKFQRQNTSVRHGGQW